MTPLPALPTSAASGSGSAASGNATRAAAAAPVATGPDAAQKAELSLTPGLEQLSEAEIAAAFMGETVEAPDTKQKQATNEDTEEESTEETEESDSTAESEEATAEESEATEETEDESTAEGEDEDETKSDLEKGLDKANLSPALRKRFKALLKENPTLKREVEDLKKQIDAKRAEPEVVTPSQVSNLFAAARNAAEVEQHAAAVIDDAEEKLDWLDTHREGGTYGRGENAMELTPEQVAEYRTYYRKMLRSVDSQKASRLDYLKRYAETVKEIGADKVLELVKPTVETRESRYAKHVVHEPDYLEFLADAKAGREHREKLNKGIKFVEVKPGGKAPVTKPGGEKPKADGSKTGSPVKPAPKGKEQDGAKPAAVLTQAALDKLRADAEAGDKRAQEQLDRLFMGA